MSFFRFSKIFLTISGVACIGALTTLVIFPMNKSIEFTGGTNLEIATQSTPQDIQATLASYGETIQSIQMIGDNVALRTKPLSEEQRQDIVKKLVEQDETTQVIRFDTIGPSIGKELTRKSIVSLILVSLAIVAFVAFAFRSRKEANQELEKSRTRTVPLSFAYGVVAVIALVHDVMIPFGLYHALGLEVGTLAIIGILSILGLSVNDTIVIFDRIRENLSNTSHNDKTFQEIAYQGVTETLTRSIATSLTLVIALLALMFFGPQATKPLALLMTMGMVVGTYSSICVATPLLVFAVQKNILVKQESID